MKGRQFVVEACRGESGRCLDSSIDEGGIGEWNETWMGGGSGKAKMESIKVVCPSVYMSLVKRKNNERRKAANGLSRS